MQGKGFEPVTGCPGRSGRVAKAPDKGYTNGASGRRRIGAAVP